MKRYLTIIFITIFFCFNSLGTGQASSSIIRNDLQKFFTGYEGTFVLYDENADRYTIYNEQQSGVRLSPCSTFKIFNSLIGLESGVLDKEDVFTLIKWNGQQYPFPAWNRDQTLASAIANSVVWYYQEVARRVGNDRMVEYIDKLQYGNQDISGGIDQFWLRSSLKISAREQVELLKQLYNDQLPFAPDNMAVARKIIVLSTSNDLVFSGKTGSAYQDGQYTLGWFVGCVEKNGHKYFFATNIQNAKDAHGGKAREISKLILKELELL
ncbi:class D beta-lactamase [Sporomusa malonica]|uniref:beta-lactamase n=1 Tax=Sporomusa malonica TaxID=112901 RepID=A0A1W2BUH2_9FIRM|nr:class D beta-lactamase [Sporomusa malonica]SMC76384.1 bla regulator protein blaR1 [Sporomusa malonica]